MVIFPTYGDLLATDYPCARVPGPRQETHTGIKDFGQFREVREIVTWENRDKNRQTQVPGSKWLRSWSSWQRENSPWLLIPTFMFVGTPHELLWIHVNFHSNHCWSSHVIQPRPGNDCGSVHCGTLIFTPKCFVLDVHPTKKWYQRSRVPKWPHQHHNPLEISTHLQNISLSVLPLCGWTQSGCC